ncbi:MAG: hypothetical protein EOL88_09500, partial [Bacteroidia bacterium]|nr:hypothetical protein [Bacteroidia bacterium]
NLRVFNPEDDDYYFSLVLIEDDIVSPQKNSNPNVGETPIIHDYHHRHVLRGDINGIWGEQVDIAAGNQVTGTHTYTLSGEWEPENCSIIGYLYRNSTKEILHAAGVQVNE